ncbi:MAG: PAS domain S-box protein, partial [Opitutus sp.]
RFKTMANSISQLAWIAQGDGYIFWYNDRWYEYTGTTPEEMQGWGWQKVHHLETLPKVLAKWNAAIVAGERFDMEFPLRGADGTFRRFLTRAQPIKDRDGRVSQWVGTNTDVDELKRSADALRQSQAMYHSLVEQMPAGVFRKNAEGRYVFVNSYFCRLRNVTADKFIDRLPGELESVESRFVHEAVSHHATIMLTGESIEVLDEYHRADGATLYFHVVKSPVYDGDGNIIGTQGVLFDVTANKQAQIEIVRLNAELEQRVMDRTAQLENANKELEAFSYSVSHDLRAPLRAVNGFAEIMLEDFSSVVPEEGRRLLERIRHGGQRMGELIDDLLGFSRLSRLPLNRRILDTADLVRAILEELKPEWEGRTVELRVASLPPSVGDLALLRQVWINLLSNALKYSRNRTPAVVEVGSKVVNDETIYFVRDNGTGFDMKYAHKLFGVFQRLHRQDEFEGTGVGLAIVQRVVHRHGGRVWAEAEEDRGATFHFTLATHKKS